MKTEGLNQKNLTTFEKGLITLIREDLGDNTQIKIREQTAPMTQRREIKTNNAIDQGYNP